MTNQEERSVVSHKKNMNICNQGMSRREVKDIIIQILNLRRFSLNKYGRFKSLSKAAKDTLVSGNLSHSFWRLFEANHPDVKRKRQGTLSMNQALNCTGQMAIKHLDDLAEELVRLGIFTNAVQDAPGKCSGNIDLNRIYNHYKTPQSVNYGVDGTANRLVYAGIGEECKLMILENHSICVIQW